jgi:heme/copper-type cytochrome/quinol oxidase subunit 3
MEASASAPLHAGADPEPPSWQPRALWLNGRLLCGSISFFFIAFVFAYFYLRSLDLNKDWKIAQVHGHVGGPVGWGTAVMVLFVLSAAVFRLGRGRATQTLITSLAALGLGLVAVILQCIEYTTLSWGPTSGGYASVFVGWTSLYAVFALFGLVWVEIQAASLWRIRREGVRREVREGVPTHDEALLQSGLEACSFYWAYFVFIGFVAWVILYLL